MKPSEPQSAISKAVRDLRTALQETQQGFAYRMKTAVRTIARWETVRPPKGKSLARLERLAWETGAVDVARILRQALAEELNAAAPTPEELAWSHAVGHLLRNRDLRPRAWASIAAAIRKELEALVKRTQAGKSINGDLGQIEADLFFVRMAMDASAEKRLESLAHERQAKAGKPLTAAEYEAMLKDNVPIYQQYLQERANAAEGTRYDKSLAGPGTRPHKEAATQARPKRKEQK